MAEAILFCAGCNVKFRAKKYDETKAYKCPKCGERLKETSSIRGMGTDGSLDTMGNVQQKEQDPLVGQMLDRYRIVKKLGEGGMGAVYKAQHASLKRFSALKVLPEDMARKMPDAVQRFVREARAAAALTHPNIVAIYAVGDSEGRHFIDMEYVEGEDLEDRQKRQKQLPIDEATRIIRDTAKALGEAHARSIVHRDIKPANIMVTKDGTVKVMDFGLAKDVQAGRTQLTMSGAIMGTPYYMSPEQCEGKTLDGRSDIYSLGVTYFSLLTGEAPFKGTSYIAILLKHKTDPVPDPRTLRPDLPLAVCQIIAKAMAKDPGARYQTCDELVGDLDKALAGEVALKGVPVAPTAPPPQPSAAPAGAQPPPTVGLARSSQPRAAGLLGAHLPPALRAPWVTSAAVTVALCTVFGLGWMFAARDSGESQPSVAVDNGASSEPELEQPPPETPNPSPEPEPLTPSPVKAEQDETKSNEDRAEKVRARMAAENAKAAYRAGRWAEVVQAAAQLAKEPGRTQACRAAKALVDCLLKGSQKHQAIDDARTNKLSFWKRLGPTMQVPGDDGKPRTLPAGVVRNAVFSPDSRRVALVHTFGVDLWDSERRVLVRRLDGHDLAVWAADYSPDGSLIATASADRSVCIWQVRDGRVLHRLRQQADMVMCVRFSPDGRTLASGGSSGSIWLWDAASGRSKRVLKGRLRGIKQLLFSPDGRRIAAIGHQKKVLLWDIERGKVLAKIEDCGRPYEAAFSPDGKHVAVACGNRTVLLWDVEDGFRVRSLKGHKRSVRSVDFSPDSTRLASASYDGTVRIWDVARGLTVTKLTAHSGSAYSVRFSRDGNWLVSTGEQSVKFWDLSRGRSKPIERSLPGRFPRARISPDGRWALVWMSGAGCAIFEMPGGSPAGSIEGYGPSLMRVAVSPDGSHVACSSSAGSGLWRLEGSQEIVIDRWGTYTGGWMPLAFSPDGQYLASGKGPDVRLLDLRTGKRIRTFTASDRMYVTSLAWSPDGKRLASGADDGKARIWDPASGQAQHVLAGDKGYVYSVAFSADGRCLASAGRSKTVHLWDAQSGEEIRQVPGPARELAFDGPGQYLALFYGREIRLLDALGERVLRTFRMHDFVRSFCLRHDGERFACGIMEGAVQVFDCQQGNKIWESRKHRYTVSGVAFSRSDPLVLASASQDGSVCLWRTGRAAQQQTDPGAGELAWIGDLFAETQACPIAVIDLDRSNVVAATAGAVREQESGEVQPACDWLGGAQLLWQAKNAGDAIKLAVNAPATGQYVMGARITRSQECGIVQTTVSGQVVGEPCDCFVQAAAGEASRRTETVKFGVCALAEGRNVIELKVVGKHPDSQGYAVGIDAIVLWPKP